MRRKRNTLMQLVSQISRINSLDGSQQTGRNGRGEEQWGSTGAAGMISLCCFTKWESGNPVLCSPFSHELSFAPFSEALRRARFTRFTVVFSQRHKKKIHCISCIKKLPEYQSHTPTPHCHHQTKQSPSSSGMIIHANQGALFCSSQSLEAPLVMSVFAGVAH